MSFLGGPEMLIIMVVVMLMFGSTRLPKLARSLGQAQQEFRSGLKQAPAESSDDS
jgi:sec-independent protein translocase protein TatA